MINYGNKYYDCWTSSILCPVCSARCCVTAGARAGARGHCFQLPRTALTPGPGPGSRNEKVQINLHYECDLYHLQDAAFTGELTHTLAIIYS